MTGDAQCVGENETIADVAQKMKSLDVARCRSVAKTTG
jgi:hypothetical protein